MWLWSQGAEVWQTQGRAHTPRWGQRAHSLRLGHCQAPCQGEGGVSPPSGEALPGGAGPSTQKGYNSLWLLTRGPELAPRPHLHAPGGELHF